jgi:hypothetical protein
VANPEKDIAEEVLDGSGLSPSRLGLRFDRVVVRVLGELRAFAEADAPEGVGVIVTISAPIRLPAKTAEVLQQTMSGLIATDLLADDRSDVVHGNEVRLRLVRHSANGRPKLVGFVHSPGADVGRLLDLAERWLGD